MVVVTTVIVTCLRLDQLRADTIVHSHDNGSNLEGKDVRFEDLFDLSWFQKYVERERERERDGGRGVLRVMNYDSSIIIILVSCHFDQQEYLETFLWNFAYYCMCVMVNDCSTLVEVPLWEMYSNGISVASNVLICNSKLSIQSQFLQV